MNVVKEINRINQAELDQGLTASWHDDYKDSAYIFVGGLHFDLTEGDVITIFSQYGEVMDVNLPRDKETGKTKGFGFLMYEDQRSTILAVDNLNGAKVLDRTLRVDHAKNYKQPKLKNEEGDWVDAEEQSLNAKPVLVEDDVNGSGSSGSSGPDIDPEDPMRDYLIAKWKEERSMKKPKKKKSKGKHKDETPEELAARKARRKEKRAKKSRSEGVKAVEDLLNSLDRRDPGTRRSRSTTPQDQSVHRFRSRSRTPVYDRRASSSQRPSDRYDSHNHKRRQYSDTEGEKDRDHHSRNRQPRGN